LPDVSIVAFPATTVGDAPLSTTSIIIEILAIVGRYPTDNTDASVIGDVLVTPTEVELKLTKRSTHSPILLNRHAAAPVDTAPDKLTFLETSTPELLMIYGEREACGRVIDADDEKSQLVEWAEFPNLSVVALTVPICNVCAGELNSVSI